MNAEIRAAWVGYGAGVYLLLLWKSNILISIQHSKWRLLMHRLDCELERLDCVLQSELRQILCSRTDGLRSGRLTKKVSFPLQRRHATFALLPAWQRCAQHHHSSPEHEHVEHRLSLSIPQSKRSYFGCWSFWYLITFGGRRRILRLIHHLVALPSSESVQRCSLEMPQQTAFISSASGISASTGRLFFMFCPKRWLSLFVIKMNKVFLCSPTTSLPPPPRTPHYPQYVWPCRFLNGDETPNTSWCLLATKWSWDVHLWHREKGLVSWAAATSYFLDWANPRWLCLNKPPPRVCVCVKRDPICIFFVDISCSEQSNRDLLKRT